jgi:NADPH-dependent 2,4-dienoyl-CoA reductase/sulfur reductase-like enzyme
MAINNMIVIGGSDAGISASLRAREQSPETGVTMPLANRYPNFSICGLPFYLSGEVSDWNSLTHRATDDIERKGIQLVPYQQVTGAIWE